MKNSAPQPTKEMSLKLNKASFPQVVKGYLSWKFLSFRQQKISFRQRFLMAFSEIIEKSQQKKCFFFFFYKVEQIRVTF